MKTDFKYHSDIRRWRKQLSKLKFVLEDKSEVIGRIWSSYATAIIVLDKNQNKHIIAVEHIISIEELDEEAAA